MSTQTKYRRVQGRITPEYRVIAETIVGHKLPPSVVIHHHDGHSENNRRSNLVICQDQSYHILLHHRAIALRESGHSHWRKCVFCKKWDDPANLYISPRNKNVKHRECAWLYAQD